jgi:membrane-bound ClpP family serine protease
MIDIEEMDLDKRYYCFECGQQAFACELKGHVCFDRFPHLSIQYLKPKWHNRLWHWIIDNFTGILGFLGVTIAFPLLSGHFEFTTIESIVFGISGGFLAAYLFIMARDD